MDQLHVKSGQNGLSRRKFLSAAATLSIGTALLPTLTACAPSASKYDDASRRIWEQSFRNESGLNSGMLEMVRYATLAPSGHNRQPWKFSLKDSTIRILPDYTRRLAIVDPEDRELFISLGCAL